MHSGQNFSAIGDGGNIIYVNKAKKLVVASNAIFLPRAKDRVELIENYVEEIF